MTYLEIVLNADGLRVESQKAQGLFSKSSRPNRYLRFTAVGSQSGGLDQSGPRSNLGHCFQIGRLRGKRGAGGGAGISACAPDKEGRRASRAGIAAFGCEAGRGGEDGPD